MARLETLLDVLLGVRPVLLEQQSIPLETWTQARATAVAYHKPRAARALEAIVAVPVVSTESGAMNRFKLNERKVNG